MKRVWIIGLPLLALVLAVGYLFTQLQPELPQPTGTHKVGYERFAIVEGDEWVDVQAFYPASETSEQQPLAIPADLAVEFGKAYNTPAIAMQDDRPLPAFTGAKVVDGKHPVLIFNHGHGMYATQNSHQIIELASHGYVVLALNHPGHSLLSKNGDLAVPRQPGIAEYSPEEVTTLLERQKRGNDELRATTSLEEWKTAMRAIQNEAFADIVDQFPVWTGNNTVVLDALENGEFPSTFADNLDLTKIGYFGHSFGGAVSTHMGMNDDRVKAAYNMDGPVFTWSLQDNSSAAFCFAYGDSNNQGGVETDFSWVNQQIAKATNGCERTFLGASHMNSSDLNEISMMKWFGQLGPIDKYQMRDNLNGSLLEFFNLHLRGTGEISERAGTKLIQH